MLDVITIWYNSRRSDDYYLLSNQLIHHRSEIIKVKIFGSRLLPLVGLAMCCPLLIGQSNPQNVGTYMNMWYSISSSGYPQLNMTVQPDDGNENEFLDILEEGYGASLIVTYHTYQNPTEQFACSTEIKTNGTGACQFYGAQGTQAYIFTGHFSGIGNGTETFYLGSTSSPVIGVPPY
jgi:hypothetical protein